VGAHGDDDHRLLLARGGRVSAALDRLFAPRSIAVIGASADPDKFGGRPLAALERWGFTGELLAVNPGRTEVMGVRSVPSVAELPFGMDLAVIVVPAAAAVIAVEEVIGRGIGSIALMTGGFAESGEDGQQRDARVRELVRSAGIPLLGPNCPGFINLHAAVAASSSAFAQREEMFAGPVSLVAQSGAIAGILADRAFDRGIGLGHVICTGNEMVLRTPELVRWLCEQPEPRCIALYLEGFDPGLVEAMREARHQGLPIAVLKAGRTDAGAKVVASHTAAIAGGDDAFAAACESLGVARAENFDDLLELAQVLACVRPRGPRLGVAGISGGMNSLFADAASAHGMTLPELAPPTVEQLLGLVPSYGSVENPVDIASSVLANPGAIGQTLVLLNADPSVDVSIATINDHPPALARALADGILSRCGGMDAAPLVQWSAGPMSLRGIRALGRAGVAVVTEPDRCARALHAALLAAAPVAPAIALDGDLPAAPAAPLSEGELKARLADSGLPVPEARRIQDPAQAPDAVRAVGGSAVIKADCVGTLHKTEAGALALGVDAAAAPEVAREVLRSARSAFGTDAVRGLLVERQLEPLVELLVSVRSDPQAGPVVTVALGGTLVEVLGDAVSRLAPVDERGATAMLGALRGAPLLGAWRGRAAVDMDALARLIARVSELGAAWSPRVAILELNPVAALEQGAAILDATAEVI
jgi:acetate---CoA ligase (ADP-forming)